MRNYLETLITEKGVSLDKDITIEGHFGIDYRMLINYIADHAKPYHHQIKSMLVKIDFHNGDVFHYLQHLAEGMVLAQGWEIG